MKLLLDENLSRRVVPFIQKSYPDSSHVVLVGLENKDDKTIRQYAIEHDFVVVTKDADFYEMSLLYGQPPKIVWLKIGNQSKAKTINTLLENKLQIEKVLFIDDKACVEIK